LREYSSCCKYAPEIVWATKASMGRRALLRCKCWSTDADIRCARVAFGNLGGRAIGTGFFHVREPGCAQGCRQNYSNLIQICIVWCFFFLVGIVGNLSRSRLGRGCKRHDQDVFARIKVVWVQCGASCGWVRSQLCPYLLQNRLAKSCSSAPSLQLMCVALMRRGFKKCTCWQ
jgi:hypothetical protein